MAYKEQLIEQLKLNYSKRLSKLSDDPVVHASRIGSFRQWPEEYEPGLTNVHPLPCNSSILI